VSNLRAEKFGHLPLTDRAD